MEFKSGILKQLPVDRTCVYHSHFTGQPFYYFLLFSGKPLKLH